MVSALKGRRHQRSADHPARGGAAGGPVPLSRGPGRRPAVAAAGRGSYARARSSCSSTRSCPTRQPQSRPRSGKIGPTAAYASSKIIHVQREGQRAIFLGKGGGAHQADRRARATNSSQMLERPVHSLPACEGERALGRRSLALPHDRPRLPVLIPVISTGARSAEWRDLLDDLSAFGGDKVSPLRTFGAPVETTEEGYDGTRSSE